MEVKIFKHMPEEARKIREEVFIKEQGFQDEFDSIDDISMHLVMFQNENLAAVCRIYRDEVKQTYIVGRIAVMPEYRGKKIGAEILHEAERQVEALGGKTLYLHAQCRACVFYEKQGYQKTGTVEMEEGCPHIWMYKKLKEDCFGL